MLSNEEIIARKLCAEMGIEIVEKPGVSKVGNRQLTQASLSKILWENHINPVGFAFDTDQTLVASCFSYNIVEQPDEEQIYLINKRSIPIAA